MSTSLPDPTDPARLESQDEQTPAPVVPARTEGMESTERMESTGNSVPADPADPDEEETPAEVERTAKQWWPYLVSALMFLVAPYVIGVALPAATATAVMLVLLPVAAFGTGLIDGVVFRHTWSFPILTAAMCWAAMKLYSDPGTWIYAVGVLLLCLAGSRLGGRRAGRRGGLVARDAHVAGV